MDRNSVSSPNALNDSSVPVTLNRSSTALSTSSFNSSVADVNMTLSAKLQLTYYIAIALTGLIGNTTTIFVFSQRRLRSLRSSFFLTCLAITDLIFILILIVALLDGLQVPVMTTPVCMLTIYLSHIASYLSSNFTLAYTSHRLIAVFFPMKATILLKQRTNRILAGALFIFACSFYSLAFPVTSTNFRSNTTNLVICEEDRNKAILFPFLILDTLFTFIIPFSCISCMNLAIVYKLHTKFTYKGKPSIPVASAPVFSPSGRTSYNSSGENSVTEALPSPPSNSIKMNVNNNNASPSNSSIINSDGHHLIKQKDNPFLSVRPVERSKKPGFQRSASCQLISLHPVNTSVHIRSTQCRATASAKTTKMLLAASTAFLVFNLPYHLLLFCFLFNNDQPSWMLDAVNVARLWFFASFCMNFFVYAICGQRFRNEVVRLFCCSLFRRYFTLRHKKKLRDRQDSMYFTHRLLPVPLTHLSH